MHNNPEDFWEAMLSRETQQIQRAFAGLNAQEQQAVLEHLKRMISEDGWHPEQVSSAQAALRAIAES